MGLFGPSWTWEEIQKKNSIMSDLKRENDRVLNEQRRMLEQSSYEGDGGGVLGIFAILLSPFIIGFILYFCFFIVGVLLKAITFDKNDILSNEILVMVFLTIIIWITFIVKYIRKNDDIEATEVIKSMFIAIFASVYIGVMIYDLLFNDELQILSIILYLVIGIFSSGIWAFVGTIIGYPLMLILGKILKYSYSHVKILLKMKRIKNSKIYLKIIDDIREIKPDNIEMIFITSFNIEFKNTIKNKIIDYKDEGYSSLDKTGMKALAILIKKEYKVFKINSTNDIVALCNVPLKRLKEKEEKKSIKKVKKEKNKINKEKIKNGEDW